MRKKCFKCQRVLPVEEFYVHPKMADGRIGKCHDCAKGDVKRNYAKRRSYYSSYEQRRNQTAERRAAKLAYQKRHREKYPMKYKARMDVANAVRDGRLKRRPCRVCGGKAQAHHPDYAKPLEVDWLCFKHHRETGHGQVVIAA